MRKWLLMVGLASVVGIAAVVSLRSNTCAMTLSCYDTASELNGSYAYHGQGSENNTSTDFATGGGEQLFADVSVLNFDGKGDIYGTSTVSFRPGPPNSSTSVPGGVLVCTYKLTGSYCVSTGIATISGYPTNGCDAIYGTAAFVLDEHGNAGSWVFTSFKTTPTNIINNFLESGDFKKQ